MSRTLYFFILGGQLASSGGQTLFSDSLKLQLYQHRGQLNLLKVEVYLKPPHLNIALWELREKVYKIYSFISNPLFLALLFAGSARPFQVCYSTIRGFQTAFFPDRIYQPSPVGARSYQFTHCPASFPILCQIVSTTDVTPIKVFPDQRAVVFAVLASCFCHRDEACGQNGE